MTQTVTLKATVTVTLQATVTERPQQQRYIRSHKPGRADLQFPALLSAITDMITMLTMI